MGQKGKARTSQNKALKRARKALKRLNKSLRRTLRRTDRTAHSNGSKGGNGQVVEKLDAAFRELEGTLGDVKKDVLRAVGRH